MKSLIFVFLFFSLNVYPATTKFDGLSETEKSLLFADKKKQAIYQLVCGHFYDEVEKYQKAITSKEFSIDYEYFPNYPFHFNVMKDKSFYVLYENMVRQSLHNQEIYSVDPSFKDWLPPSVDDLPCQEKINQWDALSKQWKELRINLPANFYKEFTLWHRIKIYFNDIWDAISYGFDVLLVTLIIGTITVYSIVLHYALIFLKNKEGLWLLVTTPLSALYWQKHISLLFSIEAKFIWKIFITSFILFFVYSLIAYIYLKLFRKKEFNLPTE